LTRENDVKEGKDSDEERTKVVAILGFPFDDSKFASQQDRKPSIICYTRNVQCQLDAEIRAGTSRLAEDGNT
jgi:hypothetical protein